jgi:hypothetical protein
MTSPTKCGNYKRYKGKKLPTCGCDMCKMKFEIESIKRREDQEADEEMLADGWKILKSGAYYMPC